MELIRMIQAGLPGFEPFFLVVTSLGSERAYIAVLALYFWLVSPAHGRRLGLLFGLSYGVNTLLKAALDLPRPYHLDPALASPAAQLTGTGPGLPSGHAQVSATVWFYLAWLHRRPWLWGLAAVLVALVSFSRLYLGVHFVSDVLVGLLLGAAAAALGARVPSLPMPAWGRPVGAAALFALAALGPAALAQALAVSAGFWVAKAGFRAPHTLAGRLLFGGGGLALVFALAAGLGAILGDFRNEPVGAFIRYFALTLFAAEGWPALYAWASRGLARAESRAAQG